ncbi:MAG: hypothetical protein HKP25_04665 [Marinicaulis sp.]|nr:hypothetical protein [Marinicaulis sp.]
MLFFLFAIACLGFSGWWFYKNTSEAGKHIEAKIGFSAVGVAFFVALTTYLAKTITGILGRSNVNLYDAPLSYIFFLACGGITFGAGTILQRALKNTPNTFLSDENRAVVVDGDAAGEMKDRVIRATAFVLLIAGGLAGGAKGWAGAADKLPFQVWLVTLPALAIWFGRRSETLQQAAMRGAAFGAAFFLPSFVFYLARNFGENLMGLAISVLIPAVIGAIAFSTKGPEIGETSDDALLKSRAEKITIGSFIGIILPQFFQPAVFDEVRKFHAVSKARGDESIMQSVSTPNIISRIMLVLMIAICVLSILAAVSDAM